MSDADVMAELLNRCRQDHDAWINGNGLPYALPEDGSIMGAIGGWGFGGPATAERQAAVASRWLSGTGEIEFVNGSVAGDIAWLAFIERAQVVFDAEVGAQRWDLRVTEVFRRTGDAWERVHRHADPMVDRRAPQDAAALLA